MNVNNSKTLLFSLILAIVFCLPQNVSAEDSDIYEAAKKLTLFKSNRKDVEKVFNYIEIQETIKDSESYDVYYRNESGKMTVTYSMGRCAEHNLPDGFDVDQDTVIEISVLFFENFRPDSLGFNLNTFEIETVSELPGLMIYHNEDLGIKVSGSKDEIQTIDFSPSKKQIEKYSCESKLPQSR